MVFEPYVGVFLYMCVSVCFCKAIQVLDLDFSCRHRHTPPFVVCSLSSLARSWIVRCRWLLAVESFHEMHSKAKMPCCLLAPFASHNFDHLHLQQFNNNYHQIQQQQHNQQQHPHHQHCALLGLWLILQNTRKSIHSNSNVK